MSRRRARWSMTLLAAVATAVVVIPVLSPTAFPALHANVWQLRDGL